MNRLVERCCSAKNIIGLCRSLCFRCQVPASVCVVCHSDVLTCIVLFDSCTYRRLPHIGEKLSASCARWTACARTYLPRCAHASHEIAPAGRWCRSVHGVKMHVSRSRNAHALRKSEYAVSLIHHIRPLNRRDTHKFRDFRAPRFRLGALSDRARSGRREDPDRTFSRDYVLD